MFDKLAKKKFENWYHNRFKGLGKCEMFFYPMDFSFQWGVILEFADSEGYIVEVTYSTNHELQPNGFFEWYIVGTTDFKIDEHDNEYYNTRKEAQKKAIKKLNELLNK